MKNKGIVAIGIAGLAAMLSACAPAGGSASMTEIPTEAMTEMAMTEPAMTEPAMTEEMMTETPTETMMTEEAMMEGPTWFGAAMIDVNTGSTFKISDFQGKVVLVETMAQWCPKCKQQQDEIKLVQEKMGQSTP